jgi:hypothetical protein
MTASRNIALLAATLAIATFGAASAQTPDTRIIVHGAINAPAHMRPVTDGRDDSVPEIAVVYDAQNTPAPAQPVSAAASNARQTSAQPASTSGANLNQAVKSQ